MRRGFGGADPARRRQVLRETIAAFDQSDPPDRYHRLAWQNLDRWRARSGVSEPMVRVEVFPGDWGEVARSLTSAHGVCFAVLNMANAYVPGGAYVEGAVAQEENMFRRTDCHFRIGEDEYDGRLDRYRPEMTRLLSAEDGVVYLDAQRPRVCIRGPEDRSRSDLGYPWLPEDQVFPFLELRAAAQDLRNGSDFDPLDSRRRVSAQLNTLRDHRIRHVVFGAFGCGAFRNPAHRVAQIYREEIAVRTEDFSVIAFAIFSAGYGPDNYTPFAEAFRRG
jgi:Microbial-type PARG, catalytic domain